MILLNLKTFFLSIVFSLNFTRLKWVRETAIMLAILIEILMKLFENGSIYLLHSRSFGEQ